MGIEDVPNKSAERQDYETLLELRNRLLDAHSNNPDANRGRINELNSQIRYLEKALKKKGELPMEEEEGVTFELDELFPNAKSGTIVNHKGKKYQIKYFPLQQSRTGKTVQEWGHTWKLISKD